MKEKLTTTLSSFDNVTFAYLFGSYAKDEQTRKSDVDVAVFLQNTSLDAQLELNYQLSKQFKKKFDLVILNQTKNLFLLDNIFRDGILVKEHKDRFDYELKMQHDILDFKAFRKYIDAA